MQPQKKPSKRAQTVMDRVTEKLGAEAIEAFRTASIRAFRAPVKKPSLRP